MDRIDLISGFGCHIATLHDQSHIIAVIDHGTLGGARWNANGDFLHGLDALERFDAAAEFRALGGSEFRLQPKVDVVE